MRLCAGTVKNDLVLSNSGVVKLTFNGTAGIGQPKLALDSSKNKGCCQCVLWQVSVGSYLETIMVLTLL